MQIVQSVDNWSGSQRKL